MFVIAGVSGNTGSVVANTLQSRGKILRLIVREESKAAKWAGAEVVVADLDDVAALTEAFQGADGAYLLLPPAVTSKDVIARGKQVIDAYKQAIIASKIPHVVFLSSVGAQHEDGTGPIKMLAYAERVLSAIPSTKFTFIRAAYFMENLGGMAGAAKSDGILPVFANAEYAFPWVATHDIGITAAEALLAPPKATEVIELQGPELYSYTDSANAFSRTLGKAVKPVVLPIEQLVPALTGMGLSDSMANLYREMMVGLGKGLVAFDGKGRAVKGTTRLDAVVQNLV